MSEPTLIPAPAGTVLVSVFIGKEEGDEPETHEAAVVAWDILNGGVVRAAVLFSHDEQELDDCSGFIDQRGCFSTHGLVLPDGWIASSGALGGRVLPRAEYIALAYEALTEHRDQWLAEQSKGTRQ